MSQFKLSNQIFTLALDAQEISVFAYLCSLPSNRRTLDGCTTVSVKQSTIASQCGIKSVRTVARVINRLCCRGLVETLRRSTKANHYKGTYSYIVRQLGTENGYFFVDRHIFGKLVPRQMLIYLFLCKSFSTELNICWNSYNDIAAQTGMKRELVIQTVNELVYMHLIVRMKRKARDCSRVFIDNHYQIVFFVRGRIRKKRNVRPYRNYDRTGCEMHSKSHFVHLYHSTFLPKCQAVSQPSFWSRGSPSDATHLSIPKNLPTEKKKSEL
ncbi:MAG: hypothetical protein IKN55_00410 [Oscillospiraceae bacterium]|nr:hypothetical protein [Oscillospiraceae bacterium]